MSIPRNSRGIMSTYTKMSRGGGCPGDFALHSVELLISEHC